MIEEQIEQSEKRSAVPSRQNTNTGYRRQRTESAVAGEEDEYDVDYDNLVVSDILGVSGAPLITGFGTFGLGKPS